nr:MAG TPA: hypothetical protein [Caudoviricetes sp.]
MSILSLEMLKMQQLRLDILHEQQSQLGKRT